MANRHFIRNGSDIQHIAVSVSQEISGIMTRFSDNPVSGAVNGSRPDPAPIGAIFVDLGPKARLHWLRTPIRALVRSASNGLQVCWVNASAIFTGVSNVGATRHTTNPYLVCYPVRFSCSAVIPNDAMAGLRYVPGPLCGGRKAGAGVRGASTNPGRSGERNGCQDHRCSARLLERVRRRGDDVILLLLIPLVAATVVLVARKNSRDNPTW